MKAVKPHPPTATSSMLETFQFSLGIFRFCVTLNQNFECSETSGPTTLSAPGHTMGERSGSTLIDEYPRQR